MNSTSIENQLRWINAKNKDSRNLVRNKKKQNTIDNLCPEDKLKLVGLLKRLSEAEEQSNKKTREASCQTTNPIKHETNAEDKNTQTEQSPNDKDDKELLSSIQEIKNEGKQVIKIQRQQIRELNRVKREVLGQLRSILKCIDPEARSDAKRDAVSVTAGSIEPTGNKEGSAKQEFYKMVDLINDYLKSTKSSTTEESTLNSFLLPEENSMTKELADLIEEIENENVNFEQEDEIDLIINDLNTRTFY